MPGRLARFHAPPRADRHGRPGSATIRYFVPRDTLLSYLQVSRRWPTAAPSSSPTTAMKASELSPRCARVFPVDVALPGWEAIQDEHRGATEPAQAAGHPQVAAAAAVVRGYLSAGRSSD